MAFPGAGLPNLRIAKEGEVEGDGRKE